MPRHLKLGIILLIFFGYDIGRVDKVPVALVTETCLFDLICEGAAFDQGILALQVEVLGEGVLP